jgi:hypothetical protein
VAELGPADPLGTLLPLELARGFLGTFGSLVVRPVPSFMTIFAWISSNFAAFTFLGQNNVTNLLDNVNMLERTRDELEVYVRPEMSLPTVYIFPCRLLTAEHRLYATTNRRQGLFQDCYFVISGHVTAR